MKADFPRRPAGLRRFYDELTKQTKKRRNSKRPLSRKLFPRLLSLRLPAWQYVGPGYLSIFCLLTIILPDVPGVRKRKVRFCQAPSHFLASFPRHKGRDSFYFHIRKATFSGPWNTSLCPVFPLLVNEPLHHICKLCRLTHPASSEASANWIYQSTFQLI